MKSAKAKIRVILFYRAGQVGILANALDNTANTFTGNISNRGIASFEGYAIFVTGLRHLYIDKFTVATILKVKLHHGLGCGGATSEEVNN